MLRILAQQNPQDLLENSHLVYICDQACEKGQSYLLVNFFKFGF